MQIKRGFSTDFYKSKRILIKEIVSLEIEQNILYSYQYIKLKNKIYKYRISLTTEKVKIGNVVEKCELKVSM